MRDDFTIPADAGARVALCRALWDHADPEARGERLLFIETWGVWPSGEHPPLFARLRSAFGEQRPLITAPGHLFDGREGGEGLSFLIVCAYFLWDCWVLDSRGSVAMLSHDEYGVAFTPKDRDSNDLRGRLRDFGVLRSGSRHGMPSLKDSAYLPPEGG
ncbi:MAG TPA: hypothetical protein VKE51_41575 [Vicinamibacterales bacterium]|nr:hypothetical protein [Vicinamibacterales bacterium]